ncbi:MAG: ABC transporter substrate-binding protein [Thermomicrobiales bacterium]|nr:ABC transporter substrate-binding protein [Thermomicrobiales bacterium]
MFHTSMNRRSLVQAAALGAILPRFASAQSSEVTLALDWYANANHAGIYMALANGYFEEAGVTPEIFVPADPTTVLQTVGAGRDTFGITYHNDVLVARQSGIPVKSIAAVVQHPLNSIMVLESSDIQSPADLGGKTIAMAGVPSDEAYLATILENVGLSLDDVETVNVGYDLMPAILSERADAVIGVYWTHETILAEHEGYPVRYFRVEEHGVPDYYELVIVAGEKTIEEQPEMVSSFLGALRRGYQAAADDLDAALAHLIEESPDLVADVEREGLDLLAPVWTSDGAVEWGTQTAERWDAYTSWAQENELVDADIVAADAWVDLWTL